MCSNDFSSAASKTAYATATDLDKKLFVISWPAYHAIHPTDSRADYEKLLQHEITHLFHSAYLKGADEKMGPVWFYEGFACFVANQFSDAVLPKDLAKTINSLERGSYKDYVAIFFNLKTHKLKSL